MKKTAQGFTILELLIVIAIIGVLALIPMITLVGAPKKTRDARRQSDLKQYQNAIEIYAAKNNSYPTQAATINAITLCGGSAPLGAIPCVDDPNTARHYRYNSSANQYVLWAQLESFNPAQYFVVCSSGKVGNTPTNPNPSGGACPI